MSELVSAISSFKSEITFANASSFTVSTALIKETISANESLSASAANKIASTLAVSTSMFPCNVTSCASNLTTSELVAVISACKA